MMSVHLNVDDGGATVHLHPKLRGTFEDFALIWERVSKNMARDEIEGVEFRIYRPKEEEV